MGVTTTPLHPDWRSRVLAFIGSVAARDGVSPLSEYKEMRLDGGLDARERIAMTEEESLVGYGQAAWHRGAGGNKGHWAVEVVVDQAHREGAVARELIDSLRLDAEGASMTLWARAPYVARAAGEAGWQQQRELLEMGRSLPIDCLDLSLEGFEVATFRVGVDERAWLSANNAAFTGHPENGSMTRRDLERRIAQSWFDPEGFFLAWHGEALAGSCWTKVHDNGVGEIYIVGVVPGWEGRGLGRALVCRGLDYLGNVRHVATATLFVEGDNERALALYDKLGFETSGAIQAYGYPQRPDGMS
jgi:mycothiol synthase